jgi:hypothetical protein
LAALRALIAITIAFSLIVAPVNPPRPVKAMHAIASMAAAESAMPDCHKAKHHKMPGDCGCCDDHAKSKCPDGCTCLLKCGGQALAFVEVAAPLRLIAAADFHPVNPAKPPGERLTPAGPPPRA